MLCFRISVSGDVLDLKSRMERFAEMADYGACPVHASDAGDYVLHPCMLD